MVTRGSIFLCRFDCVFSCESDVSNTGECVCRIALGKHLKKLHPDQDLRSDDPDHAYYNNVTTPSPVAKRQKLVVVPVVRSMRKKKPPYSKPQPLKLMKGKKNKLLKGKGHKGLITKGVKLRSKRYGCARLRTIADYHREKRMKEVEDLMNVTTPAGCGSVSARRSSSKQYKEAASIVDLDHCYVKVDEPSVYKTRVRIENQDSLKVTVVRTPETSTFVHSRFDDNVDASGGSETIILSSPEHATTHMQETILEGASRLVTMLRQQMESGDDLSNLLPSTSQYEAETMSSDIHDDVGIAGLDLMNDVGGNIEQQLTDILDSMAQETSPGAAGSQHTKTVPDLDNLVQDNIDRDMQLVESCDDDVAENTTQGDGEGCGMDVDEIELGEADYQLWQESHNSGANIEVQDDSAELRGADSCTSIPLADSSSVNNDAESSNGSVTDHRGADDDSEQAASEKDQEPCLVDHQYY